MIYDQIFDLLTKFKPGVRVLVLSDSCHSGTVINNQLVLQAYNAASAFALAREGGATGVSAGLIAPLRALADVPVTRAMPDEIAQRTYLTNKAFYDPILSDPTLANAADRVRAACLLISGCQDNQLSSDGTFNGAFTGMLKRVWANGKFGGSVTRLVAAIKGRMPPDQTPNLFPVDPQQETSAFAAQPAFTI